MALQLCRRGLGSLARRPWGRSLVTFSLHFLRHPLDTKEWGGGSWGAAGTRAGRARRCWTSNDNMGFWWILRFPVFLAILVRGPATRWQRREGSEAAAVGRPAPSFLAGLQQPEETDSTLPEWRGREAWHSARTLAGTHPWLGTRSPRAPGARAGLAADPPRRGTGWGRALLCPHVQINFSIFIRVLHVLVAKLRAHQMRCTDYKFRWVLGVGRQPADPDTAGAEAGQRRGRRG